MDIIFTTKIKRSFTFLTVTVRKAMGINPDDYVSTISQGTEVKGKIVFQGDDIWMELTAGLFIGRWIALKYRGKVFADPLPINTAPVDMTFAWVKDDFTWHGKSRPTYTNAKPGFPARGREADYLAGKIDFVESLPMTVTLAGTESTIMTNRYLQWIISLQPKLPIKDTLQQLTGLFAPDRAWNNFKDPKFAIVNGEIVTQNVIKMPPLLAGSPPDKKRYVRVMGSMIRKWGKDLFPIEVIDTSKPTEHLTPEDSPHLFFEPFSSARRPLFNSKGLFSGFYDESLVWKFHWFSEGSFLPIHGRGSNIAYIAADVLEFPAQKMTVGS